MFERTRKTIRTTRRALTTGAAFAMFSALWDSMSRSAKDDLVTTFPRMLNQIPDLQVLLADSVVQQILHNLVRGDTPLCDDCDELAHFGSGCTERYGVERSTWIEATDGGAVDASLCIGCLRDRVGRDLIVKKASEEHPELRAVVHASREEAH